MNNIFRISLINYKNYKKSSKPMIMLVSIASILILLFITMGKGFSKMLGNYNEDIELREIEVYKENGTITDFDAKALKSINDVDSIYRSNVLLCSDKYKCSIDGVEFTCDGYLTGVDCNYSSFSLKKIYDMNDNKYNNPIISGSELIEENTCIVDQNYAYVLGYSDPSKLIGKCVELSYGDIKISEIKVVGIYSYKYGSFDSCEDNMSTYMQTYYINSLDNRDICLFSSDVIKKLSSNNSDEFHENDVLVYVNTAENVKSICDTIENKYNLLTINLIDSIEEKANLLNNVEIVIICFSVVLELIGILVSINSLIIKIEHQKNFAKMLHKIGFTCKQIRQIYVFENLINSLKIALFSIIATFVLSLIMDIFMQNAYSSVTSYRRFLFLTDIRVLFVYFIIVVGVFAVVSFLVVSFLIKREKYDFKN